MRTDLVGNQGVPREQPQFVVTGGQDDNTPKEAVGPGRLPVEDDPGARLRHMSQGHVGRISQVWPPNQSGSESLAVAGFAPTMFPLASIPAQAFTTFTSRLSDSGVMRYEQTEHVPAPPMKLTGTTLVAYGLMAGSRKAALSKADYRLPGGVTIHSESVDGRGGLLTAKDRDGKELQAERVKNPYTDRSEFEITHRDGTLIYLDPDSLRVEVRTPPVGYDSSTQWPGFTMRTETEKHIESVDPDRKMTLLTNVSNVVFERKEPDSAGVDEVPYSRSYTGATMWPTGLFKASHRSEQHDITTKHGQPQVDKGFLWGLFRGNSEHSVPTEGSLDGDTVKYADPHGIIQAVRLPIGPTDMDEGWVQGHQTLVDLTRQRYQDPFSVELQGGDIMIGGQGNREVTLLGVDGKQTQVHLDKPYRSDTPPVVDDRGHVLVVDDRRLSAISASGRTMWSADLTGSGKPETPEITPDGRITVATLDSAKPTLHVFDTLGRLQQRLAL